MPATGATLLAANHPNALVDALVAVAILPRRLRITAKATLFEVPLLGVVLRALGMVPLRRLSDELRRQSARAGEAAGTGRNAAAFEALVDALAEREVILIFPEGISHVEPELAPLRSGLARIALDAVTRGITPVVIVPLGLTFEHRDAPRSRVLAEFGEPIALTDQTGKSVRVDDLTTEVDQRLRAVTLNFSSHDIADRTRNISTTLAAVSSRGDTNLAAAEPPLAFEVAIARRVQVAEGLLQDANPAVKRQAASFLTHLDSWYAEAQGAGVTPADLWIDVGFVPAVRFVLREGLIALAVGPPALWGAINHWVPLRLARWIGLRTAHHPDEPATRTIAIGFGLVIAFYVLQTIVVGTLFGLPWALGYLLTLPPSATWDFHFRDRWRRVFERASTYRALRRNPQLRRSLQAEAESLRQEAVALEEVGGGAEWRSLPETFTPPRN